MSHIGQVEWIEYQAII